jgi:hypothetical protein
MAETRSSSRRSAGLGTEVESDTVVDSNAASVSELPCAPDFLRISDENMRFRVPLQARNSRQNGTLWTAWLKERFICLNWCVVAP